jgi:hypothetical protein
MKNGLMIYKSKNNRINIGDYIQSLAARQFFDNKIDKFVCREYLDQYSEEDIRLIMNGWFLSEPKNWPPSSKIHPLFISFHLNSSARKELLNDRSIDYFKKYEPIGCRDLNTFEILQQKGVKSYFSSCLTLTLGNTFKFKEDRDDKIYFVDPYFPKKKNIVSLVKLFYDLLFELKDVYKLTRRIYSSSSIIEFVKGGFFYRLYSKIFDKEVLFSAEYIQHYIKDDFNSEDEKFEYAEDLLIKYAKAKLIITSRIHCALPSLGFHTPVIYIDNVVNLEYSECRLKGLRELFNIIECNNDKLFPAFNFDTNKITLETKIVNKENYLSFIDKLNLECNEFCNK